MVSKVALRVLLSAIFISAMIHPAVAGGPPACPPQGCPPPVTSAPPPCDAPLCPPPPACGPQQNPLSICGGILGICTNLIGACIGIPSAVVGGLMAPPRPARQPSYCAPMPPCPPPVPCVPAPACAPAPCGPAYMPYCLPAPCPAPQPIVKCKPGRRNAAAPAESNGYQSSASPGASYEGQAVEVPVMVPALFSPTAAAQINHQR
jgi:hypothetical protein